MTVDYKVMGLEVERYQKIEVIQIRNKGDWARVVVVDVIYTVL